MISSQIVDLEADRSKLKLQLTHSRGETDPKHVTRFEELEKESKDKLKKRILELENEIGREPSSLLTRLFENCSSFRFYFNKLRLYQSVI